MIAVHDSFVICSIHKRRATSVSHNHYNWLKVAFVNDMEVGAVLSQLCDYD